MNPSFPREPDYRQPLSIAVRRGLFGLVVFFHVGIGWALTRIEPAKLVVGEASPMEVRMVAASPPAELQLPAPPEDTPPPHAELESMVQPPPPDLPPPAFPIQAPPPAPPKPKPPVVKPQPAPAAEQAPQAPAAPAQPAGPKTVSASQVAYLSPLNPLYPLHSRRVGETGTVHVRVLIDIAGRPAQVGMQASSGHPALDESALNAVRAARFRPYSEGGVPQAVWVLIPINFVLQ